MKYCGKCGRELFDEAVVCPDCGCGQGNMAIGPDQDSDNFGWFCLGFCVPVAGLVLYLVWKEIMPKKASKAGKGALTNAILCSAFLIIYIIYFFIVLLAVASTPIYY